MKARLAGGRFRSLNETFYTSDGDKTALPQGLPGGGAPFSIPSHSIPFHHIPSHSIPFHPIPSHPIPFHPIPSHPIPFHPIPSHSTPSPSHPTTFHPIPPHPCTHEQYHEGYREQVASWPINPLHVIIDWIRQCPATLTVADFGCGEAKLAASVPNKVISLDLVAAAPHVIACNMAHTPLQDSSVNIAVFCLSLMGADYPSFLSESHRVLQPGGSLIIAEVRSRFDPTTGGAELKDFLAALKHLGFRLVTKDLSNKMFLLLFLEKVQAEVSDRKGIYSSDR
ncbi:unnamed protein product [Closterium sp. Naga37s-1]|nr:unnamed protein product [Closterium sp. Naga37s-1]